MSSLSRGERAVSSLCLSAMMMGTMFSITFFFTTYRRQTGRGTSVTEMPHGKRAEAGGRRRARVVSHGDNTREAELGQSETETCPRDGAAAEPGGMTASKGETGIYRPPFGGGGRPQVLLIIEFGIDV